MTKEGAIATAQKCADRSGATHAVLNLNRFNPLYVVREWHDSFTHSGRLVHRADPAPKHGPAPEYRALLDASDIKES